MIFHNPKQIRKKTVPCNFVADAHIGREIPHNSANASLVSDPFYWGPETERKPKWEKSWQN